LLRFSITHCPKPLRKQRFILVDPPCDAGQFPFQE